MFRFGYGATHLADENGVRKTINEFYQGNYGRGTLSAIGDLFNFGLTVPGGKQVANAYYTTFTKAGNYFLLGITCIVRL